MLIFLEGPDGSGKSTLGTYLSKALNLPLAHTGGPPSPYFPNEFIERCYKQAYDNNIIYDRCSFVSEFIYGPILRKKSLLKDEGYWLSFLNRMHHPNPTIVIYCRTDFLTLVKVNLTTKPYKSEDHIKQVKEYLRPIVDAYDNLMEKIPHIKYDRDLQVEDDVLCAVSTLLSENKPSKE